jgi:hypothetical protein
LASHAASRKQPVHDGDIAPDGASFAVVRRVGASQRLQFPIGKSLFETQGNVLIAPDGRHHAYRIRRMLGELFLARGLG